MKSQMVLIDADHGRFNAYASIPDAPSSVAVLVLQEIFGVNANIRATVDAYAYEGYAAIAPDLYWRSARDIQLDPALEDDRARAIELMKSLDHGQAAADGLAAIETLRTLVPRLDRSCAIGFCLGGSIAFSMGARCAVDASVSYYGTGIHTKLAELDGPNAQMLLHIAGEDHLCPPDAQAAIKAAAAADPDHVRYVAHPGVGHAFARIGGQTFDKQAADCANGLTLDLLRSLAAVA